MIFGVDGLAAFFGRRRPSAFISSRYYAKLGWKTKNFFRIESLLDSELANLRPLVIPHHKGRKRMHLELKDTVTKLMTTDIK